MWQGIKFFETTSSKYKEGDQIINLHELYVLFYYVSAFSGFLERLLKSTCVCNLRGRKETSSRVINCDVYSLASPSRSHYLPTLFVALALLLLALEASYTLGPPVWFDQAHQFESRPLSKKLEVVPQESRELMETMRRRFRRKKKGSMGGNTSVYLIMK